MTVVYLGSLKITGNRTMFSYFNKRRGNAIQEIHAIIHIMKRLIIVTLRDAEWNHYIFLYILSLILSDINFCEQSSLRVRILEQNFLYIFYFPIIPVFRTKHMFLM